MTTKIQAVAPRLSDEDRDPIEEDENEGVSLATEGQLWNHEDIEDIRRIIDTKLPDASKKILNAFLQGLSYNNLYVTEKYWRYHFTIGIEILKREIRCI